MCSKLIVKEHIIISKGIDVRNKLKRWQMKENELLSLIDKYFQGETSLEEEEVLRRELRQTDSQHPAVTEAKAVLSYIAMIKRTGGRKGNWRRWSVAAAVAVLIGAVGLPLLIRQDNSVCSTMIACRMDNSQETAFNLISSQLEAVGYASDEVAEEVLDGLVLMSEY